MANTDVQVAAAKKLRSTIKGSLTRQFNYISTLSSQSVDTIDALKVRATRVEDLFNQFNNVEAKIFDLNPDEESVIQEVEDNYIVSMSLLNEWVRKRAIAAQSNIILSGNDTIMNNSQVGNSIRADIRLPRLDLMKFEGDHRKWQEFFDVFSAAIGDKEDIPDAQKFQYLKSCLQGQARSCIQHLNVTETNYREAMQLLIKKYDRKKFTIAEYIHTFVNQPSISRANANNVRNLLDVSEETIRGLHALGTQARERDPWLIYILVGKLDSESRSLWAQKTTGNDYPTYKDFIEFLENRTEALETVRVSEKRPQNSASSTRASETKSFAITTTTTQYLICSLCSVKDHKLCDCPKFKEMSVDDRRALVSKEKRCYNCLKTNHSVYNCKIKTRCQQCQKRHNSMLHKDLIPSVEDKTTEKRVETEEETRVCCTSSVNLPDSSLSMKVNANESQVILPTAIIKIVDGFGEEQMCRALLDSASMESFISEDCVCRLGLQRKNARVVMKGLDDSKVGSSRGKTKLKISIAYPNGPTNIVIDALIIPKIAGMLPQRNFVYKNWSELNSLLLADPSFNRRGPIDVLLGAEVFYEVVDSGKMQLKEGLVASKTILGWTIAGRLVENEEKSSSCFTTIVDIDDNLRKFWELESVDFSSDCSKLTQEEQQCEDNFINTTKRCKTDGKFVVQLPVKNDLKELGSTFHLAASRLRAMERRFQRDPVFKARYISFMEEYEQLGHMNRVTNVNESNYFLPHHGVLKESSSTTKLRVVFDASAKSTSSNSLNDLLLIGPVVQSSLTEILLRFRQHKLVITADIEKMYRMIWVSEPDAKFQNILWRRNTNDPMQQFQLKTLTYGTASASYLSTRCLKELSIMLRNEHLQASSAIKDDIYVDDLMTGGNSVEEVIAIKNVVVKIMKSVGMKLHKWSSNNSVICQELGCAGDVEMKLDENLDATRVLGLVWKSSTDVFTFQVSLANIAHHTKRSMLSEASKIFDPLGWLAPTVVRAKILFQSLWMRKIDWDDELDGDILVNWLKIRDDFQNLNNIRIPRWLGSYESIELHGFCDASQWAYSAVVYSVVRTDNGNRVQLVVAKTKVAPIKQVTIPRLELMGAVLLSKLVVNLAKALKLRINDIVLWTDSQIVLDWLDDHPRRWPVFVANRTSAILTEHSRERWRHVPSELNPADPASRGVTATELAHLDMWWNGPSFLLEPVELWPVQKLREVSREEVKHSISLLSRVVVENSMLSINFIEKFSSFHKMTKILAIVLRFKNNGLLKMRNLQRVAGNISTEEMTISSNLLVKFVQEEHFGEDIKALNRQQSVPSKSKLKSLNVFLDDDAILRVGGRLGKASIPFHTKHPIILPNSSALSKALVNDYHEHYHHAGVGLMMNLLRQRYWIIRMKNLVRATVHRCISCIRQRPKIEEQLMGELPAPRVNPSYTFSNVGVDYCGPFRVQISRRRGQSPMKAYVCVFICMSTKAVHLECTSDLTTDAFLGALKRFIGRRGCCKIIHSDRGTNFVGANNHLQELYKFLLINNDKIYSFLLRDGITWKFNPPGAPHMGGLWEAAVKSMKAHLKRVVGESILTLEEFTTLIVQIESMLNSRPLCSTISDDDVEILTPAHFLIGRSLTMVPEVDDTPNKISLSLRWELVKKMVNHFWRKWHQEYLTSLQSRIKWKDAKANLAVDDVVLIRDENQPSTRWPMGRITRLSPGTDHKVRVVEVKTSNGTTLKSISKLVKLPIC